MNAIRSSASYFARQLRVIGALMMRELTTRFGREGLGFAWLVGEPLIFCFGVIILWSFSKPAYEHGVRIAPFVLGFLGVGLYHAAYISEVIRTGIEAVPRGQMEAAQSQGFTRAQAYWYIVLPQTFKIILPPLCNQALNLVKNTSVLALVAGGDLMYRSDNFVSLYGYLQGYIVCCLMYFIICFPLAMLVQWLERRSKERPRGVSLAELGLDNVEEA